MYRLTLLLLLLRLSPSVQAQPRWSVELMGAGVYNVPLPLTISQQAHPDIKLTARYATEPFKLPVYYDWRISRWEEDKSWEVEFIHHKLYLQNTPSEVQKFSISHGFNMLFINRGFYRQGYCYRAGAGVIIAHPESIVRGMEFDSSAGGNDWGYYLSGPALQASVNRLYYLGERFFIHAGTKITFGYASVKVAQGRADVYNLAFHLLLGLGVDVKRGKG